MTDNPDPPPLSWDDLMATTRRFGADYSPLGDVEVEFVNDYLGDVSGRDPRDLRYRATRVPVLPIHYHDQQRRPPGHVSDLAEAMRHGKDVPPILVHDGTVIDGLHRMSAAHKLGWTHIDAIEAFAPDVADEEVPTRPMEPDDPEKVRGPARRS